MAKLSVGTENDTPIELHYSVVGSGKPVVLIHGWPLSSRSWESQVGPLVDAGRQVVTYDRRGFGDSSHPYGGYDYDTFAADLDALMRHLDLREATLVGFSMGGGEVVRYLATYGADRVEKAVLVSAVPPYLYQSEDNPDGGLDDETIATFQDAVRSDRPAFLEDFTKNFFSAGEELKVSEAQRSLAWTVGALASPKGTLDCIDAWGRTDFRADLEKVTVPTLVLHGDSDAIVPFEVSGKRAAQALSDSELVVVGAAPHGFNISHPDEFNEALLSFLNR